MGPIPLTISRSGRCPPSYNQPLAILITSILVELNERRLPRFRSRLATAYALLPGAIVRKTASLHLQLAYRARSLYSLTLAPPASWRPRVRPPGVLFDY